jgi:hypothetical protein
MPTISASHKVAHLGAGSVTNSRYPFAADIIARFTAAATKLGGGGNAALIRPRRPGFCGLKLARSPVPYRGSLSTHEMQFDVPSVVFLQHQARYVCRDLKTW